MNAIFSLPNFLSLLRILLTPLFVFCLIQGGSFLLWAVVIFIIAPLTDYFDGYFARKFSLASKCGMFLDPLADKVLILTTFSTFYFFGIIDLWMVVLIVFRDLVITSLRIVFMLKGTVLKTSILGKWKTTSQFFLIYVILVISVFYLFKGVNDFQVIASYLYKFTLFTVLLHSVVWLTIYSGLHYFVSNWQIIKNLFER
ncbi:CDP-diacylglycerol--glycerol-3-phosphate 3-phosphatidyltransferase [Candidatus Babeliales bacterium]|nr:CDP-diacylglycerol--glycerol-3-phosphate 3-phosphatidyltransferase [Candidatus Babeliales bacterium]